MQHTYDDEGFFQAYAHMPRSRAGLAAAGEWGQLRPLFPQVDMGRRISSAMSGSSSHVAGGMTSSTAWSTNPRVSRPFNTCVRVWCCLTTWQPRNRVSRGPG